MNVWIYKNSDDNKNRFILGKKGDNTLICIGINPSTASPDNLDNTLKTVEKRAKSLGYDSWIMINVYPQRATNPKELEKGINLEKHKNNIKHIKTIVSNKQCDIWAAWGNNINIRPYLIKCLQEIVKHLPSNKTKWFTIGKKSKAGHPHHPLYLKNGLPKDTFDIDKYLMEKSNNF